jgi:uncharacterized protein (TIGR03067 family)
MKNASKKKHVWRWTILGLVLFFAGGCSARTAEEPKAKSNDKELAVIAGDWEMVALEREGKKEPRPKGMKEGLSYQGASWKSWRLTSEEKKIAEEGTFALDLNKRPTTIDISTSASGSREGKTVAGIFELTGDDLRLAVPSMPGKIRPRDFSTKPGTGTTVVTYKRLKS